MKMILCMLTAFTMGFLACKHDPQSEIKPVVNYQNVNNNTVNDSVSFQTEILPLLTGNCTMDGCHNAASAAEGVVLDNYNNVINTAKVIAFNPAKSELYEVLVETNQMKIMPRPPSPPLTKAQIELVAKWINQGARNTNFAKCDTNIFNFGAVQKVINNSCIGCHSSNNAQGGVNLSDYINIRQQTETGKLLNSIGHLAGSSPMPKGGNKLEACKINMIKKWATAGYPNN